MSEQEISYTYMADEAGNYIIFKPDGDYMSPQSVCGYLNALEAKLERMDAVLKELADLANDGERHDLGGPHISIPWVLDRFAADDLASLPAQQKPTEEGMEDVSN